MKASRTTADRVRPVLQAMERSIEAARHRRLHASDGAVKPRPTPIEHNTVGDEDLPRRKARPKRATPMRPYESSEYRAEAV